MDWGFVIGLVVIFLVVISPIMYFGRKLSKYIQKHDPESELAFSVTPAGIALNACMVGYWAACAIAVKLAPNSGFGKFVDSPIGVAVVIVGSLLGYPIAASVLKKFGYPIMKKK